MEKLDKHFDDLFSHLDSILVYQEKGVKKKVVNPIKKMIRRILYRELNMFDLLAITVPLGDHDYAAMRFETHENDILKLTNLYLSSGDMKNEPEWLFPKGKPDRFEDGIMTASREFTEETGIESSRFNILPTNPIVSYYQADNDFIYETQYWIGVCDAYPEMPDRFQNYEVMARRWFNAEEVQGNSKPHQISVLHEVTKQLRKYVQV